MKRAAVLVLLAALAAALAFRAARPTPPPAAPAPLPPESARLLREELAEDPSLGTDLGKVTRESVMRIKTLSPEQKERLWERVQRYQRAAAEGGPSGR